MSLKPVMKDMDWQGVLAKALAKRDVATLEFIRKHCDRSPVVFSEPMPPRKPSRNFMLVQDEPLPAILTAMAIKGKHNSQLPDVVKFLLGIGVDVKCTDAKGNGALHILFRSVTGIIYKSDVDLENFRSMIISLIQAGARYLRENFMLV